MAYNASTAPQVEERMRDVPVALNQLSASLDDLAGRVSDLERALETVMVETEDVYANKVPTREPEPIEGNTKLSRTLYDYKFQVYESVKRINRILDHLEL
jgi:hypothetical protein